MSVVSKNLYDLLGNDDGDSDTPKAPVKTVDKNSSRTVKRNVEEAPARQPSAPTGTRRGGGYSGNEAAFRDRNAGHDRNRGRSTDETARGGPRGGHNARVRGGRGGRFPRDHDDRHNKGPPSGGEKQADKAGDTELKDEQAGEEIAKADEKEAAIEGDTAGGQGEPKEDAGDAEAEPEEKHMTLSDYLALQAEKKLALENEKPLAVRKANEGIKDNKKWSNAKPLVKDEDEDYFAGTGGKAKRERERKTKQLVEIDQRYVEPERPSRGGGRGGRGRGDGESTRGSGGRGRGDGEFTRGSGGRGRGDGEFTRGSGGRGGGPRGGRGAGGFPSRGDHHGEHRGDHRGGHRGDYRGDHRGGNRGGPRGDGQTINPSDTSAFPSLGA